MFCQHSADGSLCSDTVMESESSIWMAMWSATSREPFLDTWRHYTISHIIKQKEMSQYASQGGRVNKQSGGLISSFIAELFTVTVMLWVQAVVISVRWQQVTQLFLERPWFKLYLCRFVVSPCATSFSFIKMLSFLKFEAHLNVKTKNCPFFTFCLNCGLDKILDSWNCVFMNGACSENFLLSGGSL